MMEIETMNTRVLIIDDEEIVRDNIEDILIPHLITQNEKITNASSILFDDDDVKVLTSSNISTIPVFKVDKAINGMDGLEKIKKSIAEDNPYAVIFLDMRMPGWDGLETAIHIREVDIKAEIIIITAYSDRSIEEIIEKAGQNVGYHCKPYASEEIVQLATKAVNDYNKLRNLEKLITVISNLSLSESHLTSLLQNILDQLAMYIGSDTALLGKLDNNNTYQKLFSFGSIDNEINLARIKDIISTANFNKDEVEQIDEVVFVKLEGYAIFALLSKKLHLKTEKLYLVRLFVQNAAKAIKNLKLHEELLQKEKLSAVGKAMGMLMHDLRPPIKNIPALTSSMREEGVESEWLDMIDLCGQQASEIFDDFLDFLNETPLLLLPIDVEQLIKDSLALTYKKEEFNNILIRETIEPGLSVLGDNRKLKRVIMNLINNSVDALYQHHVNPAVIDIHAKQAGSIVEITIRDNGPGIPEKIMSNLFEAFVTEKNNGTGLGLAIVKQYIVAHKGTISVTNNNGAVFTIELPSAHS